ncbi:MAG: hypothetical protein Kow0063_26080 [Anaerolineae bacterium]
MDYRLRHQALHNNQVLVGALVVLTIFFLGSGIAQENVIFMLLSLGLLPLVLIYLHPYLGIVFSWAAFFLVPYEALRTSIPLLSSPMMLIASFSLGLGLIRLTIRRIQLPKSNLYLPIFLWAGVLVMFWLIGHGPRMSTLVRWYLQGMWGFPLVLLLVRTPYHAKVVLWAFLALNVLVALRALPSALASGALTFDAQVYVPELRTEVGTGFHLPQINALAWPLLGSIAVTSGVGTKTRVISGLGAAVILVVIVASGFGTPLITLMGALVWVFVAGSWSKQGSSRLLFLLLGTAAMMVVLNWSGVEAQLYRITSGNDTSVSVRIDAMGRGVESFLASPLAGWGAWYSQDLSFAPPGTQVYGGHNSVLEIGVRFGLLGLVPLLFLFVKIGSNLFRLGRKSLAPIDHAIVTGIQGTYVAYVVQGLVSVSIGIITWDSVFWFLLGLSTLWLSWLDTGTYDRLVA